MADYRRFLSYIYAYDGDYKMNGTGFAKLEVREGRYRLTVNLGAVLPGQGKNYHVAVYGGSLDKPVVADIGVIEQKGNSYSLKLSGMVQAFASGRISLEEAAGLVVYREAGSRIHITSWKDPQTEVRALREGIYNLKNNYEKVRENQEDLNLKAASKTKEGLEDNTIVLSEEPLHLKSNPDEEVLKDKEPIEMAKKVLNIKPLQNSEKITDIKPLQDSERTTDIKLLQNFEKTSDIKPLTPLMEKKEDILKEAAHILESEPEENKSTKQSEAELKEEPEEYELKKEEAYADSILQNEIPDKEDDIEKEYEKTSRYKNIIIIDSKKKASDFSADEERMPEKEQEERIHDTVSGELWHEFKRMYPKIRPFSDKGWEVLQIKLQDIGRLCRENWILGNNNFVLHGYYKYGYLILARKHKPDMDVYILGVPGIFSINEKFMASMFGMTEFMESNSKRPDLPKNFGYWCTHINM